MKIGASDALSLKKAISRGSIFMLGQKFTSPSDDERAENRKNDQVTDQRLDSVILIIDRTRKLFSVPGKDL